MSEASGLSLIWVTVFIAILLVILPVSADNETTANVTPVETVTLTQTITEVPATTDTTPEPATTTIPVTTNTTTETTPAPAVTTVTATPLNTTVAVILPTTVATPANLTPPGTAPVTTGSVSVYSSPAGANILIDGIYAGTTPKTITRVPAGNHILRLTLSGYIDYEGSIYVVPGQTAQGYGTLQPLNPGTAVVPTPPVVTVIVPVVAVTPEPSEDTGLLGNSGVIAAIIGAISVIIISAAKIFTHVRPPKKEE